MKPGWKTTEAWVTAANTIITLLAVLGLLKPGDAGNLQEPVAQAIGAIFLLLGNAGLIAYYVKGRVALKKNAEKDPFLP